MPSTGVNDNIDLMHQPAVMMIMIGVLLLCLFGAVVSLRNVGLWVLRLRGVQTLGVVEAMEIVTESNGEVLRRPRIAYTTKTGSPVRSTPVMFRPRSALETGATVQVRYAAERPERMVVAGFDVRIREIVYATAGIVAAIAVAIGYFGQL
jgi:hypothetical protein